MRGEGIGRWLRKVSRRLPTPLVRRIPPAAEEEPAWHGGPLLSVIVPVYNVDEYVAECLDSLIEQTLAVDGDHRRRRRFDGSLDGHRRRVRRAGRPLGGADPTQPRPRSGAATAGSPRLAVAISPSSTPTTRSPGLRTRRWSRPWTEPDPTSPWERCAASATAGGRVPAWTRNVHTVERLGVTIDEFPEAMQDVIACNRMLRRDFWIDRIGPFAEGVAYEDHVPMVAAFVRARAFDVLSAFTYNWRIRENATSIGQQKHRATNLHDRLAAERDALRIVSAEASEPVQAAWLGRVVNTDLPVFVPAALVADDDYRRALQEAAAEFLALSGPDVLQHARADRKLMTALMAAGEWDEVDRLAEHVRLHGILPATAGA